MKFRSESEYGAFLIRLANEDRRSEFTYEVRDADGSLVAGGFPSGLAAQDFIETCHGSGAMMRFRVYVEGMKR